MGNFSSPRATYALFATGEPTKSQSTGDIQVGVASTTVNLTNATKIYCVSATLGTSGDTFTINTATGVATIGVGDDPVSQVETATVVASAGATSSGNLPVTVTGARLTGSPIVLSVALVNGVDTTASAIATKIRAAMFANEVIDTAYTVGGTGADVTLTEKIGNANDATLNIAWTGVLGVTAVTSSVNTTAGLAGVKLTNNTGDGKDFEGISLGNPDATMAILIKSLGGAISYNFGSGIFAGEGLSNNCVDQMIRAGNTPASDDLVITANDDTCSVEITITNAQ